MTTRGRRVAAVVGVRAERAEPPPPLVGKALLAAKMLAARARTRPPRPPKLPRPLSPAPRRPPSPPSPDARRGPRAERTELALARPVRTVRVRGGRIAMQARVVAVAVVTRSRAGRRIVGPRPHGRRRRYPATPLLRPRRAGSSSRAWRRPYVPTPSTSRASTSR